MAEEHTDDPRFDEIQEEIDEVRARAAKNSAMDVPDPDIDPLIPEDEREPGPPM